MTTAITVFAFSLLGFLSALASIVLWNPAGWLSYYSLLLLGGLALTSGWALRGTPKPKWAGWTNERSGLLLVFVLFTAAAFYIRFRGISELPLWSDEDNQDWLIHRYLDIGLRAAWAQQPPLHHFLTRPLVIFLTSKLTAIRFYPAFFGSLSVPLYFAFLLRTTKFRVPAILGTLLFLTNIWLVSFSKEGKPNSMAVFFAIVFCYALYDFFCVDERKFRLGGALLRSTILLFCSAALLFLTVGIQPMLFVASATGVFVVYFLFREGRSSQNAWLLALSSFLALVSFMPFIYETRRISAQFGYAKPFHPVGFIQRELLPNMEAHWTIWQQLLHGQGFVVALGLCGIFLYWLFSRTEKKSTVKFDFQFACLFWLLIFPWLGIFAYGLFVQVIEPAPRYFMVALPLCFAGVAYFFDASLQFLVKIKGGFSMLPWAFALFICVITGQAAFTSLALPSEKPTEPTIPALYDYFRRTPMQNAFAFYLTLNKMPRKDGKFMQIGFLGKDYYYTKDLEGEITLESQYDNTVRYGGQLDPLLEQIEKDPNPSDIFFYSLDRENDGLFERYKYSPTNKPEIIRIGNGKPGSWEGALLLRFRNKLGFRQTVKTFLLDIDRSEKDQAKKQKIYYALGAIALSEGDCGKGKTYFETIPLCVGDANYCVDLQGPDRLFRKSCGGKDWRVLPK
jgi:hypothetical protein